MGEDSQGGGERAMRPGFFESCFKQSAPPGISPGLSDSVQGARVIFKLSVSAPKAVTMGYDHQRRLTPPMHGFLS